MYSKGGYLYCFPFGAVLYKTCVNIHVQAFSVDICFHFPWINNGTARSHGK